MATPPTGVGRGGGSGGRQIAGLSRPAFRRKLAARLARSRVGAARICAAIAGRRLPHRGFHPGWPTRDMVMTPYL